MLSSKCFKIVMLMSTVLTALFQTCLVSFKILIKVLANMFACNFVINLNNCKKCCKSPLINKNKHSFDCNSYLNHESGTLSGCPVTVDPKKIPQ